MPSGMPCDYDDYDYEQLDYDELMLRELLDDDDDWLVSPM